MLRLGSFKTIFYVKYILCTYFWYEKKKNIFVQCFLRWLVCRFQKRCLKPLCMIVEFSLFWRASRERRSPPPPFLWWRENNQYCPLILARKAIAPKLLFVVTVILQSESNNKWGFDLLNYMWPLEEPDSKRKKQIYLEEVYLVTAFVPSDTACLANSPGNRSLTAVWISREVMVVLLL